MIKCRLLAAAATLVLAGCTASSGNSGDTTTAPHSRTPSPKTSTSSTEPANKHAGTGPSKNANIYVAIGDSYAAGFQATGRGTGHTTHHGYADQVVDLARAKGYRLRLVNFACSGATTGSVLESDGCASHYPALDAPKYSTPQADAAVKFLKANAAKVALVTVSLGGNDITPCSTDVNVGCLSDALTQVRRNLHRLLSQVRAAAPRAVIVGTTYPDIFLGKALSADENDQRLAKISVLAFRAFLNPALKSAYAAVHGRFADVTAATGGYTPLSRTTDLAPYGTVPVAVAKVCRLTYYCQYEDIHPRTKGYAIIANLVVGFLPRR